MMIKNLLKIGAVAVLGTTMAVGASASVLSGMDFNTDPSAAIGGPQPTGPTPSGTYSDMDAIFGFQVLSGTGAGFEGIFDLGSVSQFTPNTSFTLSLGNIGGFMTTNFGSDWYTRSTSGQVGFTDIRWGVVATDNTGTTDLWSTRNPAVRSTPWNSAFDQGAPSNDISAVGAYFNSGGAVAAGTTSAKKLSSTNANSWTSYQPGGSHGPISFEFFNPTSEGNTSTVLKFDSVPAGSTNAGTTLGTFTWNSDGSVLWTGAAVPEPSTYSMMGLGGIGLVGLVILRRRRAVRA